MNLEQCYTILAISNESSAEEVKASYRDMSQVWHPDRFQNSPHLQAKTLSQMQQINLAYELLMKHLAGASKAQSQSVNGSTATQASATKADLMKAKTCFETGMTHYEQKRYEQAISNFQLALHFNSRYEDAYEFLGHSLGGLKRHEEALTVYEQLAGLYENNVMAYVCILGKYRILAAQHGAKGDGQSKIRFLKRALQASKHDVRLRPQEPDSYFSLGEIYNELGDIYDEMEDFRNSVESFRNSVEAFKQVLRLDSTYQSANFSLGCVYFSLGELQHSVKYLQREIECSEYNFSSNWAMLGMAYFELGWIAQSENAYKQSILIDRNDIHAYVGLGKIYVLVNDQPSALNVLTTLRKLNADKADEISNLIISKWRKR